MVKPKIAALNNNKKKKSIKKRVRKKNSSTEISNNITLENSLWKDEFDKFVGSKTPLRKQKVLTKNVCASFNRNSSYENSNSFLLVDKKNSKNKPCQINNCKNINKNKLETAILCKNNPIQTAASTPKSEARPYIYYNLSPIHHPNKKYINFDVMSNGSDIDKRSNNKSNLSYWEQLKLYNESDGKENEQFLKVNKTISNQIKLLKISDKENSTVNVSINNNQIKNNNAAASTFNNNHFKIINSNLTPIIEQKVQKQQTNEHFIKSTLPKLESNYNLDTVIDETVPKLCKYNYDTSNNKNNLPYINSHNHLTGSYDIDKTNNEIIDLSDEVISFNKFNSSDLRSNNKQMQRNLNHIIINSKNYTINKSEISSSNAQIHNEIIEGSHRNDKSVKREILTRSKTKNSNDLFEFSSILSSNSSDKKNLTENECLSSSSNYNDNIINNKMIFNNNVINKKSVNHRTKNSDLIAISNCGHINKSTHKMKTRFKKYIDDDNKIVNINSYTDKINFKRNDKQLSITNINVCTRKYKANTNLELSGKVQLNEYSDSSDSNNNIYIDTKLNSFDKNDNNIINSKSRREKIKPTQKLYNLRKRNTNKKKSKVTNEVLGATEPSNEDTKNTTELHKNVDRLSEMKCRKSKYLGQRKTMNLNSLNVLNLNGPCNRSISDITDTFDDNIQQPFVFLPRPPSNNAEVPLEINNVASKTVTTYTLDQIDVDTSNIDTSSLSNESKIKLQHSVSLTAPSICEQQLNEDNRLSQSNETRLRRTSVLVENCTKQRSLSSHLIDNCCLALSYIDTIGKVAESSIIPITVTDLSSKRAVLRRCEQDEPINFSELYNPVTLRCCRKIGEGVFGEVFMNKSPSGKAVVLKIIPIAGITKINGTAQKKFDEILSEIIIAIELSSLANESDFMTQGFVGVKKVRCVEGRYPDHLIDLWDLYRENYNTENDNPEVFTDDQLYIVFELENAGQDLEAFNFNNALQSYSAFQQIALTLAVAENQFQFEHRDLHWGNVLLSLTDDKYADFILNGNLIQIPTHGVKATIIDYTLSRMLYNNCCLYNDLSDFDEPCSGGDYQFEIYGIMRNRLNNEWQRYDPYTNIVWLHYLVDKMINGARYRYGKSQKHRTVLQVMMTLRDNILDFKSAYDFVQKNIGN